jgi:transcriptional regulator with XRE-family HTH domain
MTQSDLAKAIHKTRSTVSGYETEGKEPDYEMLCSLAEYFGVSTDYLLGIDDCRTHSEAVFINDTKNFKRHYDSLPPLVKQTVAKTYDSFYVLLSRDMIKNNEERLALYSDLFSLLQDSRAKIRNAIDSCGGQVTDPLLLSDLMNLQNSLKNEVCAVLDKLMQADIDTAFEVKKEDLEYSERKAK